MNQENLHELSQKPIQIGKQFVTLLDLVGQTAIERTKKKFSADYSELEIYVSIREFIRFLYLTAISDISLFFPGNKLMDDVWHSFILETAEYKLLCSKIKYGYFLEHSGMLYDDYTSTRSAANLNEEQVSWLVSYVNSFGPISEESFFQLSLAQNLSERLSLNREKLNQFAEKLLTHTKKNQPPKDFSLESYLKDISSSLESIAENSQSLEAALRELLENKSKFQNESESESESIVLLSNEELESVYSSSTSLGFTLLQHLAAVERLLGYEDWQNKNELLWSELSTAKKLVGLGTTHLAHGGVPLLTGVLKEKGYVISGTVPWVTGTGIFDYILLAFESNNERVFSILPFPSSLASNEQVKVSHYKLACMNGTSTSKLTFNNFLITSDQIIFCIDKNTPRGTRKSRYIFPEIGMAISALRAMEKILLSSENPRHLKAKEEIIILFDRLENIRKEIKDNINNIRIDLSFKKDELIRDSVRLLTLVAGGGAMSSGTLASRLYLEVMLLDVIIQDPLLIEKKISNVANE